MKRREKYNLIKALDEINAPDKKDLLQKIESKKALGAHFVKEVAQEKIERARRQRLRLVAFACCAVTLLFAISLTSVFLIPITNKDSMPPDKDSPPNGSTNVDAPVDYRYNWSFYKDYYISFDDIATTMNKKISLIYDYDESWEIVATQSTQNGCALREYYVKDGQQVEVTVYNKNTLVGMDERYATFIKYRNSKVYGKYTVYHGEFNYKQEHKYVYVIYLSKQVYFFFSDVKLFEK